MFETNETQKEVNRLRTMVQRLSLENAIHLESPNSIPIDKLEKTTEITFFSEHLILVIIRARPDFFRSYQQLQAELHSTVHFSLLQDETVIYYSESALRKTEQICQSHLAPQNHYCIFRADKSIGLLINPKAKYISETSITCGDYQRKLLIQIETIRAELDQQLDCQNIAVLSKLWSKHINLWEMYQEAKCTYDYSWNQIGAVHTYNQMDTAPLCAKERVAISALEQEFLNYVNRQHFFEAAVVLDEILQKQFNHAVPLEELIITVTMRLRSVLATAQVFTTVATSAQENMTDYIHRISIATSIPELLDLTHDFFAELSDVAQQKTMRKGALVLSFIQENYQNPALSGQMICDRFRISDTYLTKLLKQETGHGLVECIHRLRLKHAKMLLRNKDLSIEKIAKEVGFTNRYGLIRSLRKYEGISPSGFRSMQLDVLCPLTQGNPDSVTKE